jgi:hypothetical protein
MWMHKKVGELLEQRLMCLVRGHPLEWRLSVPQDDVDAMGVIIRCRCGRSVEHVL